MFHDKMRAIRTFVDSVAPDLWNDPDTIEAWFTNGGPFLNRFPERWQSDRQIFLWISKHCHRDVMSLQWATMELRADKNFMTRIVDINLMCFQFASHGLRMDKDFQILPCSKVDSLFELQRCGFNRNDVRRLQAYVEQKIPATSSIYVVYLLCGTFGCWKPHFFLEPRTNHYGSSSSLGC